MADNTSSPDKTPNATRTKKSTRLWVALIVLVLVAVGGWSLLSNMARQSTQTDTSASAVSTPDGAQSAAESNTAPPAGNASDVEGIEVNGLILGRTDAPVFVREFMSLSCVHCAHFHARTFPAIKDTLIRDGVLRYELYPFPLNVPALNATMLLGCLPKERQYAFLTLLLETQEHWAFTADPAKHLTQYARLAGMDEASIQTCLADKAQEEKLIADFKAIGEKFAIQSTPSFVFNDSVDHKLVGAVGLELFKETVNTLTRAPNDPTAKPAAESETGSHTGH